MATAPFPCSAAPLDAADFTAMLAAASVDAVSAWTILDVETKKAGYLPDRRPKILFERSIFHGLTHGIYDATHPGISAPSGGGYVGGSGEYARLGEAYALDPGAALQSASWGIGQILGCNFKIAGFASVEEMVQAACASEAGQLQAFLGYLTSRNVAVPLAAHVWKSVAANYNGRGNVSGYAQLLTNSYAALQDPAQIPDFNTRAAQYYLTFVAHAQGNPAFNPNGVDGIRGGPGKSHTLAALHAFQTAKGLLATSTIDDTVLAALAAAVPPAPNLSLA